MQDIRKYHTEKLPIPTWSIGRKALSLRQLQGKGITQVSMKLDQRRDGRVVECGGLEIRCTARYRGFESPSLRFLTERYVQHVSDVHRILERCPSGRRYTIGSRVCQRWYRGFESLSLRFRELCKADLLNPVRSGRKQH